MSKILLRVLILVALAVEIESRDCRYIRTRLKCEKYCCGKGPIFRCKDDCEGIACDSNNDCGNGCCRDETCKDCPLSALIIGVIAGSVVVLLAIIIVAAICCCRSQSKPVVVGQWSHLHNLNNMTEANPGVTVVNTNSNAHMH